MSERLDPCSEALADRSRARGRLHVQRLCFVTMPLLPPVLLFRGSALLFTMLVLQGCATGGSATATGPCSQRSRGSATLTVLPQVHTTIGTDAVVAAGKAARAFLTGMSGPIGTKETEQAKAISIEAPHPKRGVLNVT